MLQIVIVVVVALVALGVGAYTQRQAPDAPTAPKNHTTPDQVDRADFKSPDKPWLVVVFTSATCETCAKVWTSTQLLTTAEVGVQNVEVTKDAELHERYDITAVPSVIIVDEQGVTNASFLGPPTSSELWETLARVQGIET